MSPRIIFQRGVLCQNPGIIENSGGDDGVITTEIRSNPTTTTTNKTTKKHKPNHHHKPPAPPHPPQINKTNKHTQNPPHNTRKTQINLVPRSGKLAGIWDAPRLRRLQAASRPLYPRRRAENRGTTCAPTPSSARSAQGRGKTVPATAKSCKPFKIPCCPPSPDSPSLPVRETGL